MPRRSSSSAEVRFFRLDLGKVMEELRRYARRCVERGARAVILIGSLARGDYTAFSDADLVIVVDDASPRYIDRVAEFLDPSLSIDIEPRVYTVKELIEMARRGARVVREVVEIGKVLAGDRSILEKLSAGLRSSGLQCL